MSTFTVIDQFLVADNAVKMSEQVGRSEKKMACNGKIDFLSYSVSAEENLFALFVSIVLR